MGINRIGDFDSYQKGWVAIAIVLLAWMPTANAYPTETKEAPAKNVIVLLADDLGWGDVGFHNSVVATPNIDQMAKDGLELSRFYAYPACSPARAALLTGRFPQRYGIVGPTTPRSEGLPVSERILAADFQAAGFQTSLIGKWHLGNSDDRKAHPMNRGFDHFYGFKGASVDYYEHTSRGRLDWQRNGEPVKEEGYSTDLLVKEAVRQIKNRDKAQPFCMLVSFNAPHTPLQAPKDLIGKYAGLGDRVGIYAAMIENMDSGIGQILKTIDDQNLRNNTVVVFASDNGAARIGTNAPFRGAKRSVYEGGIHVPCIFRLPGVLPAGAVSDQLTAIDDIFPTLATAVGVNLKPKKPLDGKSLWDNLINETTDPRGIVIAEADHALIKDDWKLIEFGDGKVELFNLESDNAESTNVAGQQSKITSTMKAELADFKQRVADDLPAASFVSAKAPTKKASEDLASATVEKVDGEGGVLASATIKGDAVYGVLGDKRIESNGYGIRLLAAKDPNGDQQSAGSATMTTTEVDPQHRWYRFHIIGFAHDQFVVDRDDLYLQVDFAQNNGTDSLDMIKQRIYPQVERERKDLKDEGTNESLGHGVWRTYSMDFRTPFAEIDELKLTVGFSSGKSAADESQAEFWVREMQVDPIDAPADYQPRGNQALALPQPAVESLVHLGGHWYFDPQGKNRELPAQFDHTNSDQLLYKSSNFERLFAENMTSWLRAGYKDRDDKIVEQDQYRPDNLVIKVTQDHIVMHSRNLPNHPTATFPDRWRMLDGNPAYIKEQDATWYIPINPKVNRAAIAMNAQNENGALPMGPIGVATNGVIFFNPFDHIFETDATWRLDRCCGHPSPNQQYHYHKYPVCVKTPWSDEGQSHSSVIGFAFDGFPVYGPYEAKGLLAKNDTENPLNDFNLHQDAQRGPHYHVTPGKFPHIIGGYWGDLDQANRPNRGGRGQ